MSTEPNEPAWLTPVTVLICLTVVGALWFFDHPTAATNVLSTCFFLGIANRIEDAQALRRSDQRVAEEAAQLRHDRLMAALYVIYHQLGGKGPMTAPDLPDDD